MTQVLELENAANWEELWSERVEVTRPSTRTYKPIPEITVPFLITSHVLAIYVTQTKGKPHWRFGGFLNQRLLGGVVVGGTTNLNATNKEKLYLNRWMLFNFPKLTTDYSISFEIPYWFEDVNIIVLQYTGVNYDSMLDEFDKTNNRILDNAVELSILRSDVEDLLNR